METCGKVQNKFYYSSSSRIEPDEVWNLPSFIQSHSEVDVQNSTVHLEPPLDFGENQREFFAFQAAMSKDVCLNIDVDIFSMPSPRNSSSFTSRLGICSDNERFDEINTFLSTFFTKDRKSWVAKRFEKREKRFNAKVNRLLPLTEAGNFSAKTLEAAVKYSVSNLLGGYGYFSGLLKVRVAGSLETDRVERSATTKLQEIVTSRSLSLFSGTPSRFKFPRPFLWDEGFHLSVVRLWDYKLFLEVLESWFNIQFDPDTNNYLSTASTRGNFHACL